MSAVQCKNCKEEIYYSGDLTAYIHKNGEGYYCFADSKDAAEPLLRSRGEAYAKEEATDAKVDNYDAASDALMELRALIESRGWRRLHAVVAAQAEGVQPDIRAPLEDLAQAPKQEYYKGKACGMIEVLELPFILIERSEELLAEMKEKEDGRRTN